MAGCAVTFGGKGASVSVAEFLYEAPVGRPYSSMAMRAEPIDRRGDFLNVSFSALASFGAVQNSYRHAGSELRREYRFIELLMSLVSCNQNAINN